jgi:hypothetical protein
MKVIMKKGIGTTWLPEYPTANAKSAKVLGSMIDPSIPLRLRNMRSWVMNQGCNENTAWVFLPVITMVSSALVSTMHNALALPDLPFANPQIS